MNESGPFQRPAPADPATDVAREIATLAAHLAAGMGAAPGTDVQAVARRIETEIRHRYGGDAPYVRARPAPADIAQAVRRERAAGVGVQPLTQRYGISRATLYRYLKRAG